MPAEQVLQGGDARPQRGLATAAGVDALPAAALAALLGLFLIWGVGFSPIEAVHNAAHDTRHSLAFPCH